MPRGPKVTYTYNGITFSTASKVVAKRAAAGNLKGAYARYISDTIGRAQRATDMSAREKRLTKQGLVEGTITEAEAREAISKYEQEVHDRIEQNLRHIFGDVYDQLRDIDKKKSRKMLRELDEILSKYAWMYDTADYEQMNQELQTVVDKYRNGLDKEEDLSHLQTAEDTFSIIKKEYESKAKQKLEVLKDREIRREKGELKTWKKKNQTYLKRKAKGMA